MAITDATCRNAKPTDKHFFDPAQPFFPLVFSVGCRNPDHWDIYTEQCPGKLSAVDCRRIA